MPELRIRDFPVGATGDRRVEVTWEDRGLRRVAKAKFAHPWSHQDEELFRWYLEDYAEYSADPAPVIARDAEVRLAQVGADLFTKVFSSQDAVGIWELAREQLGKVRVEVQVGPDGGPQLPWELLRDPADDAPVALRARTFVRAHFQTIGRRPPTSPGHDQLRVLLVVCRPGGRDDVPFRSVASHLVSSGIDQVEGLDLDVLRPPTFKRLSEILCATRDAGRPYHIVHFDGHGTWLDSEALGLAPPGVPESAADAVRPGSHGYLLFEDPDSAENQQLIDGPTVGRLLADTHVQVLVLNACRSAYTEPPSQPDDPGIQGPTENIHGRIRAYGSLAAEVANAGVPGVVAMRYNVYVVTAAQFVAGLYTQLLSGRSLGEAVAAARCALAADPIRQIGATSVTLQDWVVPVVYEFGPLVLLRSRKERDLSVVKGSPAGVGTAAAAQLVPDQLPKPPDAGFFGRDETLLALDRMFDTRRIVLLHAYAGSGKSSTAAEFARWYQATGGLSSPGFAGRRSGAILWSSFERHYTARQAIDAVGDFLAETLNAHGIAWHAITRVQQRRSVVMQILAQVPMLWVWDNVEPVPGFPAGSTSAWTTDEQDDVAGLLQDLAEHTQCKVLLTSRRAEHAWLGDLPARVQLPPMLMRESLQLARALAVQGDGSSANADWRPLLRYAAGNPLTITVLVGQALQRKLSTAGIEDFIGRIRAGQTKLESADDAGLGRSESLAASLNYGFMHAFTQADRERIALLHLFRGMMFGFVLTAMGVAGIVGDDVVPAVVGLDLDTRMALLERAADIGLLTSVGAGYYEIHPALPWHFADLFGAIYGHPENPPAARARRSYAKAMAALGVYYAELNWAEDEGGSFAALRAEEANLLHALEIARGDRLYDALSSCLRGLDILYTRTARENELGRLLADVMSDFTDPLTGGPLSGRERDWNITTQSLARLARARGDLAEASVLQKALVQQMRNEARESLALEAPAGELADKWDEDLHDLAAALSSLGNTLMLQRDPECISHFQESLVLGRRINNRELEVSASTSLGQAYIRIPEPSDLELAERWFRHSLSLLTEANRSDRASILAGLGRIARIRLERAQRNGEAVPVLAEQIEKAYLYYHEALDLTPAVDHATRGHIENGLGLIYQWAPSPDEALRYFQRAIQHHEACDDARAAGETRCNTARFLAIRGRFDEALQYASAALDNYRQAGPSAITDVAYAERLLASIKRMALEHGQG